jgi:hypothetical protein
VRTTTSIPLSFENCNNDIIQDFCEHRQRSPPSTKVDAPSRRSVVGPKLDKVVT